MWDFGPWASRRRDLLECQEKIEALAGRIEAVEMALQLGLQRLETIPDMGQLMEIQESVTRTVERVNAMLARIRRQQLAEAEAIDLPETGGEVVEGAAEVIGRRVPKQELYRRANLKRGNRKGT